MPCMSWPKPLTRHKERNKLTRHKENNGVWYNKCVISGAVL